MSTHTVAAHFMDMPGQLVITDRLGNVKHVQLAKPVLTIGRQADNDLPILNSSVSRHHAEIVSDEGVAYIVDQGSKAGTFVNEQQVVRQRLRHMDLIRFGGDCEQEIRFLDAKPTVAVEARETGHTADQPQSVNARAELQNLARFLEVNQALKISLSIEDVLRLIVDAAIEITQAERGALLLRGETGQLEFRIARDRNRKTLSSDCLSVSRTAVDQAFHEGRSLIVADSRENSLLAGKESVANLELRTVACIPMQRFRMSERMDATGIYARDVLGVLYVDSRQAGAALSKTSVTLLESLAFEASKALESVRLMQEEAEKLRWQQEFAMAREVQLALLTTSILDTDQVEVAAHSIPSRHVDGDFYDLFTLEGGRSALVLGDVSGKGIAAALLASMTQGILESQLTAGQAISSVITGLNRMLVRKSASCKFVTLFCAVLDSEGKLNFVNAGHNPPILLRTTGQTELLSTNSMVAGAFDFAAYREGETRLAPGDVLVAFTDGVTEAVGASGEMFGDERLQEVIRSAAALGAVQIRDCILERVAAFSRGLPQDDDITVMALKVKSR